MKDKSLIIKFFCTIFIVLISLFCFSNIKYSKTITNNILSYFENNQYEEKSLSEITNTMYVTMIDNKSNVISTTNINREISDDYKFTETKEPNKMPTPDDNLKLLFEIDDTNDSNGYTKAENDVIYYLDLPTYIIPENAYEEGTNINNECTNFMRKGKAIACGGIYKEDNKYKFKIKFNNVLNKKNVKASYQFDIKLSNNIYDIPHTIKTIDFGLPGSLNLYMEKETPENTDYTLDVEFDGFTSSSQKYQNWTTTLTDNRQGTSSTNGELNISIADKAGIVINEGDWFKNIEIYADGRKLDLDRYQGTGAIFYCSSGCSSSIIATIEEVIPYLKTSTPNGGYSNYTKSLKFVFNGSIGDNIKEWKIKFKTSECFDTTEAEATNDIIVQGAYTDYSHPDIQYKDKDIVTKNYNDPSNITFAINPIYQTGYDIPGILEYTTTIPSSIKNSLTIENDPNKENTLGLYYYLESAGFGTRENGIDKSLEIYINGVKTTFKQYGYEIYSPTSGQMGASSDPAVAKEFEIIDSYTDKLEGRDHNPDIFVSTTTNEDGDHYWIVLSKDTYATADLGDCYNAIYSNYNPYHSTERYYPPEKWKIHLFNFSGKEVQIKHKQYLRYFERKYTESTVQEGKITSEISVNGIKKENTFNNAIANPLRIRGENVGNGYIKWDAEVFTKYLNNNDNSQIYLYLLSYIPKNQTIDSSMTYDYINNKIIQTSNSTSINSGGIYTCTNGTIINNNGNAIFKCSNYRQFNNWELKTDTNKPKFPDIIEDDENNYNVYLTLQTMDNLNQEKILRFTFFTKKTGDNIEDRYMTDSIKLELYGSNFKKIFDNEIAAGGPDQPFALINEGKVQTGRIKKGHISEYYSTNNNKTTINNIWYTESDFSNDNTNLKYADNYYVNQATPNKFPIYYNGKYQLSDKIDAEENSLEEKIAKVTKLKSVKVFYTSQLDSLGNLNGKEIKLSEYQRNDDRSYKICSNTGKCITIKYLYKNCPVYDSENSGCSEENENLSNGFEVEVDSTEASHVRIEYETATYLENLIDEPTTNTASITNTAMLERSCIYNLINKSSSTTREYELLASLTMNKNIEKAPNTYHKNDTTHNSVTATIGYSPSEYVDITDFIDGIANLEYNSSTKKYDKEDLNTSINNLKELRKYININNLKISIGSHNSETHQTIYSNGSFIGEYSNSTINIINNTNELYKLHLVKNNGEIPALTDIIIEYDMTFYPEKTNNYRLKEIYNGGRYYISTNAEGIRNYNSTSGNSQGLSFITKTPTIKKLSATDGNYENRIDTNNHKLIVYASNTSAKIGSDYLAEPSIEKEEINSNNSDKSWQITYNINSAGKITSPNISLADHLKFNIEDNNSTYKDQIINILKEYTTYKNIKIYYNGKNTTTSSNPIYEYNDTLNNTQTIDNTYFNGTLKKDGAGYSLNLSNFNYDDIIIVTYDIDINLEKALKEMIEEGYINESYKTTDTNEELDISYNNEAKDSRHESSIVEQSSSSITLYEYTPTIKKSIVDSNNDEATWKIDFNTGTSQNDIKITDNIDITSENEELIPILKNSLKFKDLEIKYNNETIYSNGEFIGNWSNNITIKKTDLGYEFILKESNNNFISNNNNITITYKTSIDDEKYNSNIKEGIFSIINTANLLKDGLKTKDVARKSDMNYEFPMTVDKSYLGNNYNLTETNWSYTVESGRINRNNVKIEDSMTLGTDFGKYLSISKLKIKKNDNVIYDSTNNINNLNNIKLTDINNKDLVLNKNGIYQFNILIPTLARNSKIEVEYTLKVDEYEYNINNEIPDNELLIMNNVKVTSDDGTNIEDDETGSSKVTSKLKKNFDFLGYDDNGNPKNLWHIDLNLLSKYKSEELTGKEIIIEDVLSNILELNPDSVKIWKRTVTSNDEFATDLIDSSKYELNTENNTVKVKLLDPVNTPSISITFETICQVSVAELENYVTLSIDEEKEEIRSKREISLISPYSFGIVQSTEDLIYNLTAKKYLDNKLSNKNFVFSIQETDAEGNIKENGYSSKNSNSENGNITFYSLTFDHEGLYYYKIKEIKGSDKNIIYDDTEYLLRIKVIESHDSYIITNQDIINNDKNEVVFNNKTKTKEQDQEQYKNILVNPKTRNTIFIIICIIIISILGSKLTKSIKR